MKTTSRHSRPWARSLEQERAELESLATGADGADARTLLLVVGTIIREATDMDRHPTTWVDGDVVIRLRRRSRGLAVEIGRDRDGRVHALFEVTFARLSFELVVGLVHRAPSLVVPGFVLHEGDTIEISAVRSLHPYDVLDEPTEVCQRPRRTSDAVPADPSIEVEVEIDVEWDPDSTIVQPPTDELLASARKRAR